MSITLEVYYCAECNFVADCSHFGQISDERFSAVCPNKHLKDFFGGNVVDGRKIQICIAPFYCSTKSVLKGMGFTEVKEVKNNDNETRINDLFIYINGRNIGKGSFTYNSGC